MRSTCFRVLLAIGFMACDSDGDGQSCTLIGCGFDGVRADLEDGDGGVPRGPSA